MVDDRRGAMTVASLTEGSSFAGYRIEGVVGRGGMGVVYLAADLQLERPVALKLIAPELAADEGFRSRFLRESRLAASLGHPHILPVYAAGEEEGKLYLAMRYVDGGDLKAVIARSGNVDVERALRICGQVAEALDAAHRRGLVHRDVKPANVLLDDEGEAYLADFGLAKQVSSASNRSGALAGTLDYLAPEQIRGEQLDGRTDQYALSCVLYECLAGRPPFRRRTEAEVLWAHMQDAPRSLPGYEELDPEFARGLAKAKEERFPTCADLIDSAREALGFETRRVRRRRRLIRGSRVLVAGGALVLAAAAGALLVALQGREDGGLARVPGNSLGIVDEGSNRVVAAITTGATPSAVAIAGGSAWMAHSDDNSVSEVDLATQTVRQTLPSGGGPVAVATSPRFVWVSNSLDGTVSQIDPRVRRVVQTVPVGNGPSDIAYGRGSVWVTNALDNTVTRIDARTGRKQRTFTVDAGADAIAVDGDTIWVASRTAGLVSKISAATYSALATVPVGRGPSSLAAREGTLWVANDVDGTLSRVDAQSARVVATIATGESARSVAVGSDVWVSDESGRAVARVDPRDNRVVETIPTGNPPQDLALTGSTLLVAVGTAGSEHAGGTLRVRADDIVIGFSVDPAENWFMSTLTNDGLVTFRKAGGNLGNELVADLAVAIPTPQDGGRSYTFQLRRGIRYSNGELVKPLDVRRSLERAFKLAGRYANTGITLLDMLVGARACVRKPPSCDLAHGVLVNEKEHTVTFRLAKPDREFLFKLAQLGSSAVLPGNTPARLAERPLPATGPYRVARFSSRRELVLERNPQFREWSRAAQPRGYPDRIVLRRAFPPDDAASDVVEGRDDVLFLGPFARLSAEQQKRLSTEYAGQVRVNPLGLPYALSLRTHLPPFDDPRARRAVAYAVDRRALASLAGGAAFAQSTCQVLPPNFPGYRPYCPFTRNPSAGGQWSAPDLARAHALVAASGTKGASVLIAFEDQFTAIARRVAADLRRIGYRPSLRAFPDIESFGSSFFDRRNRAQVGLMTFYVDYPTAAQAFEPFTCAADFSTFCDPRIDRLVERARDLQASDPEQASGDWARIDRAIVDAAPVVPLFIPRNFDLVSKRVGNYQLNPQYGVLLSQLWVR